MQQVLCKCLCGVKLHPPV